MASGDASNAGATSPCSEERLAVDHPAIDHEEPEAAGSRLGWDSDVHDHGHEHRDRRVDGRRRNRRAGPEMRQGDRRPRARAEQELHLHSRCGDLAVHELGDGDRSSSGRPRRDGKGKRHSRLPLAARHSLWGAQTRSRLAKRSNLTSGPYMRSVGPRLAIASESSPIDKDRETWRREGCGLAQSGPLKLVSR